MRGLGRAESSRTVRGSLRSRLIDGRALSTNAHPTKRDRTTEDRVVGAVWDDLGGLLVEQFRVPGDRPRYLDAWIVESRARAILSRNELLDVGSSRVWPAPTDGAAEYDFRFAAREARGRSRRNGAPRPYGEPASHGSRYRSAERSSRQDWVLATRQGRRLGPIETCNSVGALINAREARSGR